MSIKCPTFGLAGNFLKPLAFFKKSVQTFGHIMDTFWTHFGHHLNTFWTHVLIMEREVQAKLPCCQSNRASLQAKLPCIQGKIGSVQAKLPCCQGKRDSLQAKLPCCQDHTS